MWFMRIIGIHWRIWMMYDDLTYWSHDLDKTFLSSHSCFRSIVCCRLKTSYCPSFDRGNSKYHYYGLRIKAGSSLVRLMEDQQHLAMRQQPFSQKQRCRLSKTSITYSGFLLSIFLFNLLFIALSLRLFYINLNPPLSFYLYQYKPHYWT